MSHTVNRGVEENNDEESANIMQTFVEEKCLLSSIGIGIIKKKSDILCLEHCAMWMGNLTMEKLTDKCWDTG